ncbi:hypothetical protein [Nocardioides aquiterrae]|uniref:Uncharacterized protein n=1 Tax=Nocardioides aquiterrae TaxID=203799 RepID=A0ABN1UD90_9ACTN
MEHTVAVRIATSYAGASRRLDVAITGSRAVLHEDGRATPFDTERLWPVVRDRLPPLDRLTADPPPHREPRPAGVPGPDWADRCEAMVAVAVVVEGAEPVVRTWFATDDGLWAAAPGDVRRARAGELAELLVWDVTGALETLVRRAAS